MVLAEALTVLLLRDQIMVASILPANNHCFSLSQIKTEGHMRFKSTSDRGFTTDGRWLLSCSYNGESVISASTTTQIPLGQLLIYC
ncbi:hypothetical protein U9M48_023577 [Paspalum notatum var. saurae]|uniref:Uncharacterized protein n=1 Tax=Paspalum notatum var. saurae TaxID=547442 RepID=A0AAQ3TNP0_PASNO